MSCIDLYISLVWTQLGSPRRSSNLWRRCGVNRLGRCWIVFWVWLGRAWRLWWRGTWLSWLGDGGGCIRVREVRGLVIQRRGRIRRIFQHHLDIILRLLPILVLLVQHWGLLVLRECKWFQIYIWRFLLTNQVWVLSDRCVSDLLVLGSWGLGRGI